MTPEVEAAVQHLVSALEVLKPEYRAAFNRDTAAMLQNASTPTPMRPYLLALGALLDAVDDDQAGRVQPPPETLAVRPETNDTMTSYTGRFMVVATPSGRRFPGSGCLKCAQRAAVDLASLHLNWSVDPTPEQAPRVAAALRPLQTCTFTGSCGRR